MRLKSYAEDRWHEAPGGFAEVASAIDGRVVALVSSDGLDVGEMARHARRVGGPALRALTFHQRADLLKALAQHLNANREALYKLSYDTGATLSDSRIDIDGGIGTLFVYASKGRRELPNDHILIDGDPEFLSKGGQVRGPACLRSRARASRCRSTRSTSRSGACWKSSRRRSSPACPSSPSPRPRQPISPRRPCG